MKNLVIVLVLIAMASCKTHYATAYKIETPNRNYYTNEISFRNDSIVFKEAGRGIYVISQKEITIKN